MSETTINQRLNFLLPKLGLKAGAFARALGLSETTVRNYIDRTAKPSSDVLEKISNTFSQVNLVWLITGEGEPLLDSHSPAKNQTNISGGTNSVATGRHGTVTTNNYNLDDCVKERDSYKIQLDKAQVENQSLRDQLVRADALTASLERTIDLLKAAFTRPN